MAERSAKQLGLSQADLPNSVLEVIATLSKNGFEAYLVGGGVRDTLLGLNPKDFDAVTDAKPHEIKDLFGKRCRIIGRRFQLAHVYSGRDMIEVATFRAPPQGDAHTNSDGMIVRDNVWGDIKQDFARRDFTINALYYQPIKGIVHDFCDALGDIKSKTLSLLGDAPVRIEEDPVRLLRALRFKAKLGFDFDKALATQFNDSNWALLEQVSPHRLYDESQKMFTGGYLVPLLPLLFEYKAIEHLFIYPPKEPTALVEQVAINTDKRISEGKSINPAFFYAAVLWDNYLYQLAKFKKKKMPFQDAQLQAASKVINRQRIKTAIPRFAEQFIRDIWMLQPKLATPRAKQIYKLAEHPRFRAGYDFLLLRERCNDDANPLSESTNGMGAWWQNYQTLSDKQKQQAISDFDDDNQRNGSKRNRQRFNTEDETSTNIEDETYNSHEALQPSNSDKKPENAVSQNQMNDMSKSTHAPQQHAPKQEESLPTTDIKTEVSPTLASTTKPTSKKNNRTMSRPQRAHYNREREQLLKLSLEQTDAIKGKSNSASSQQPEPLFTIDAKKLAKQLPKGVVAQVVGDDFDEDLDDDLDDDVAQEKTYQPEHKSEQAQGADNKNAKQVDTKQTTDNKSKSTKSAVDKHSSVSKDNNAHDSVKIDGAGDKRQSSKQSTATTKKGPIPSKRRRREPSSQVTQLERMAQKSSTHVTETKPNVEPTEKPIKQGHNQSHNQGHKQTDKQVKSKQQANDNKADTTSEVSPATANKGRIPAVRRRRMPSSTLSVKQRK